MIILPAECDSGVSGLSSKQTKYLLLPSAEKSNCNKNLYSCLYELLKSDIRGDKYGYECHKRLFNSIQCDISQLL